MASVRNKCETGVNFQLPGGRKLEFRPGETHEVPDEIAKKLNPKHFEVFGVAQVKKEEKKIADKKDQQK